MWCRGDLQRQALRPDAFRCFRMLSAQIQNSCKRPHLSSTSYFIRSFYWENIFWCQNVKHSWSFKLKPSFAKSVTNITPSLSLALTNVIITFILSKLCQCQDNTIRSAPRRHHSKELAPAAAKHHHLLFHHLPLVFDRGMFHTVMLCEKVFVKNCGNLSPLSVINGNIITTPVCQMFG